MMLSIDRETGDRSARAGVFLAFWSVVVLALVVAVPASAQEDAWSPASRDAAPLLYIDCDRCDFSHIRSEITLVNYVREPSQAQVHLLVTDQATGGGGRMYTLAFTGRGPYAGSNHTLTFASRPTDTSAEERDGLTRILKLGLVPYVARTPLASGMELTFRAPAAATETRPDPWRNWTFEVYGGGNFSMESTQSAWSARYGFYANRVTDAWKVRLRPYFNHDGRTIRQDDEEEDIQIDLKRHGMESYVIRSLGDHLGAGMFAEYATATIDNVDHGVIVAPAVEYSFFPYGEASTRQITLSYRIGYEFMDYAEETIYEKDEETLASHALEGAVRIRQPWGSIFSGVTGSSYLHDSKYHRFRLNSNVSFRLGHGLSLNVGGNYQRINDQLSLPRRDASLEDILLRRRQLATAYRGSGSVGLSYSFGSIFTNVVNPRF